MLPNLIHCAIIGDRPETPSLDYVPPEYTGLRATPDERILRSILLGTDSPRAEGRDYSSIVIRSMMLAGPFSVHAAKFGIEGGHLLDSLRTELFQAYRPTLDEGLWLSPAALHARMPSYTRHRLQCTVAADTVTVENAGHGIRQGDVGSPIAIPGLPTGAVIVVSAGDGVRSASWSTRPSVSCGEIAATLSSHGRHVLSSLASVVGPLDPETKDSLLYAATEHIVATDQVVAAALILTNAVAARLADSGASAA